LNAATVVLGEDGLVAVGVNPALVADLGVAGRLPVGFDNGERPPIGLGEALGDGFGEFLGDGLGEMGFKELIGK
jgi:hypothetical protein